MQIDAKLLTICVHLALLLLKTKLIKLTYDELQLIDIVAILLLTLWRFLSTTFGTLYSLIMPVSLATSKIFSDNAKQHMLSRLFFACSWLDRDTIRSLAKSMPVGVSSIWKRFSLRDFTLCSWNAFLNLQFGIIRYWFDKNTTLRQALPHLGCAVMPQ